jgi:hypothetical protein
MIDSQRFFQCPNDLKTVTADFPKVFNVLRAPEFLILRFFQVGQDFKKCGLSGAEQLKWVCSRECTE